MPWRHIWLIHYYRPLQSLDKMPSHVRHKIWIDRQLHLDLVKQSKSKFLNLQAMVPVSKAMIYTSDISQTRETGYLPQSFPMFEVLSEIKAPQWSTNNVDSLLSGLGIKANCSTLMNVSSRISNLGPKFKWDRGQPVILWCLIMIMASLIMWAIPFAPHKPDDTSDVSEL